MKQTENFNLFKIQKKEEESLNYLDLNSKIITGQQNAEEVQ